MAVTIDDVRFAEGRDWKSFGARSTERVTRVHGQRGPYSVPYPLEPQKLEVWARQCSARLR